MDRARLGAAGLGGPPAHPDRGPQRRIVFYTLAALLLFAVWNVYRHAPPPPPRAELPLAPLTQPAVRANPPGPEALEGLAVLEGSEGSEGSEGPEGPEGLEPPDLPDLPDDTPSAPRARIDPVRLLPVADDTAAARALLDADAATHLLEQCTQLAWGDLEQLGLRTGDWAELARAGASLRGQPFSVLGQLQWSVSETVDFLPRTRGELVDRDGRSWAFLVVVEPFDVRPGDVVRLAGFYLKQHELLRPSGESVSAPLLVGEELLLSAYRIEPVTELRADLFDDIHDRDLDQANRPLEGPAYFELLSYVAHAPRERLLPPDVPLPELRPSDLLAAPDAWRGRAVRMTGSLLYKKRAPLGPRGENPLGVPFVSELWVSDARAGEIGTMLVLMLDEPQGLVERQIVEVDGLFFRRWAYLNKADQPRLVPVLVAAAVRPYVPPEDTLTPLLVRISLVMVVVLGALIVYAQRRDQRAERVQRDKRIRRKGRLVAEALAAADEAARHPDRGA